MSANYDPTEADNISKVRGLIGDTDMTAPRFPDETITARIISAGSNLYAAARDLLMTVYTQLLTSGVRRKRIGGVDTDFWDPATGLKLRIDELAAYAAIGTWERYEVSDFELPRWPQDIGAGFGPTGGNY